MSDNNKDKIEHEKTSLPIDKHLKPREAEHRVKCAAMYYYDNCIEGAKSTGLETLSNIPSFYLAFTQFNAYSATSASMGGGLVAGLGHGTYNSFKSFNDVLGTIETYEDIHNDRSTGKNKRERKNAALSWLEKEMHKSGLLYEDIPNYDLNDYPDKTFKALISARQLFLKEGEFKQRLNNVGEYLRSNPKDAALKGITTPLVISGKVAKGLAIDTPKILISSMASIVTKPSYAFEIAKGIFYSFPRMLINFNFKDNNPRFKVKQVPHFEEMKKGKNPDQNREFISDDFVTETKQTNRALKRDIGLAKVEAVKLGTETGFMTANALNMVKSFNDEGLAEFNMDGLANGDPTEVIKMTIDLMKDNTTSLICLGSIMAAWTPWKHMAETLSHYVEVGTSKRAKQATQYIKTTELYDKLQAKLNAVKAPPGDDKPSSDLG